MHRYFCSGLLFAEIIAVFYVSAILGQSHYSIVAPGTIRSNRNYSVCVSLHDATSAATLRLTVRSLNSSMVLSQDVVLQPFETRLVNFMPPKLYEQFEYELRADALKGLSLSQSKKLYALEEGGPRIYVESDKSLYKPEDFVQFRVIILNEHVQIAKIVEPIRIQILDPQKNRIKQFKDIKLDRGVFATKFQLSQQPILGIWTISVHISGKYNMNKEYTFKVEKYVLPKFSVHIEHDRNMVHEDGVVKVIVYGKYTYGKYVEGTVELLLQDFQRNQDNAIKKTVAIDNGDVKADVVIGVGKLDFSPKLYINATLKEKHTNVTATTESVIIVQHQRYHLFVPDSSYEFRDGKPYRLKLHVEDWNGNAIRDRTTPVKMTMDGKEYSAYLDDNGVAQFRFEQQNIRFYGFKYKNSILTYDNMFVEQSSYDTDSSNCHLVMKPRSSVDLKDPLEIDISANHNIPYLMYTLTSHGNIVREEFIRLSANQKSHTIQIKPSIAMVPHSYLFVYYIVHNQLNFCELTIRLPQHFENQLSISAPTQVKPGQNITMTIKGQPNSRVSIVAVDKSVILLGSKNVLQKATIMNDLLFDKSYRQQYPNPKMYEYTPGHNSGLIIMTNAKYKIQTFEIPLLPTPFSITTVIRSIFPETWIFKDLDINEPSTALTLKVPDTITTWIVRAFSVNDETGFGMMEETLDIQAFQPFFISVSLPYSVKRGEVVTIPVTIFNYLRENLKTEVTMENNNEDFQFMNEENSIPLEKRQDSRNINIPANSGKSVAFNITPKKVGHIELRITAKNSITSDGVVQKLNVEPEGICRHHNKEEFLTPADGIAQRSSFEADIPPNIVPESEYLVLSVSGDVMVSTVENLDKLVQKPKGCGEQNMINMAPNILILDYLKTLGKYNMQTAIVEKAKNFIEAGYQQQLTYRHANGAFSVFGPKSSTESNWLTAYVSRFFIKGIKYSAIEPRIIEGGLQYLSSQQLDDGSFPHRGHLFEPAHQNQYGFTAFVLLTFFEDKKFSRKYNEVSEKALTFLTNNINNVEDTYSLAIMANTFQRARSKLANEILTKLKSMARESNGLKWWTSNNKNEETANDVEITAYILMALLESTPNGDYLPIFNWLIKQRNSQGGFGSTHDTVVGLQALIKYAEKSTKTQDTKVKVHYVAKGDTGKNAKEQVLEVDFNNELILQKEELPRTTRSVDVDVMGNGRVYLQFAYQYYVSDQPEQTEGTTLSVQSNKGTTTITPDLAPITQSPPSLSTQSDSDTSTTKSNLPTLFGMPQPTSIVMEHLYFIIRPKAKLISSNAMSLDICYMYRPLTEEEKLTNMVILQVQLPSGFTANAENIENLRDEENVSRIDIESSSTMLSIYFEKLEANDDQCLYIVADKGHDVAALKPSPIEMYDFYNDKRRSTIFYEIK